MMINDPLGDMLTRIRNGGRVNKSEVTVPASMMKKNVLEVLKREGFIRDFKEFSPREGVREIKVELKYQESGAPVINEIKRVSTPGRRVYSKVADIRRVYNGLGISILSTPKGILSDHEARNENVGGEVLCTVF